MPSRLQSLYICICICITYIDIPCSLMPSRQSRSRCAVSPAQFVWSVVADCVDVYVSIWTPQLDVVATVQSIYICICICIIYIYIICSLMPSRQSRSRCAASPAQFVWSVVADCVDVYLSIWSPQLDAVATVESRYMYIYRERERANPQLDAVAMVVRGAQHHRSGSFGPWLQIVYMYMYLYGVRSLMLSRRYSLYICTCICICIYIMCSLMPSRQSRSRCAASPARFVWSVVADCVYVYVSMDSVA